MRLLFQSGGGGFSTPAGLFVAPYGDRFLAVDGTCRYYALDNPAYAIVSGTLTADEEVQLSADVAWYKLASWGTYHEATCADGGAAILGTRELALLCGNVPKIGCGCSPNAPKGLQTAQQNAERWLGVLVQNGSPLSGSLTAFAIPAVLDSNATFYAWPLMRSMRSIPGLVYEPTGPPVQPESYVRFDDPSEIALLRELRAAHPEAARLPPFGFSVRDRDENYALYLRDEIDEDDASAIETLLASWRFE
jgi:hypothetical protein